MKRCIIVLSIIMALSPVMITAQTQKRESAAAFLSLILGFGSGHFLMESPKAPIFLACDLASAGTVVFGFAMIIRTYYSSSPGEATSYIGPTYIDSTTYATSTPQSHNSKWDETGWIWASVMYSGLAAFVASRLWEIVDIFGVATEKKKSEHQLNFEPTWELNPDNIALGIKVRL